MGWAFVPLESPAEIDLDTLAPFVRVLISWLDVEECPAALVGLVRSAPGELLAEARVELAEARALAIPWTLNAIVRHALIPLAALSLVDGQPVIPELGAALVDVLGDPRLGPSHRREVEHALLDSEEFAAELDAEAGRMRIVTM